MELASAALNALYRHRTRLCVRGGPALDLIEAAEKSVSGSTEKGLLSYSLEFPADLPPLTPSTLCLVSV